MLVFNYQLYRSLGLPASLLIIANYFGSTWLLRKVSPAFGRLAAVEARLEGEYRNAHSRLITNAEEIAFYNGADMEMNVLNRTFAKLMRHVNGIYKVPPRELG
jgi:ATP-binding cassette, subfamily D (ALD), peroxisomal long-chain fatty acid import protein